MLPTHKWNIIIFCSGNSEEKTVNPVQLATQEAERIAGKKAAPQSTVVRENCTFIFGLLSLPFYYNSIIEMVILCYARISIMLYFILKQGNKMMS